MFFLCRWDVYENRSPALVLLKELENRTDTVIRGGLASISFCVPKGMLERYGCFREDITYGEDLELISRLLLRHNVDFCIINKILYLRRRHEASLTGRVGGQLYRRMQKTHMIIADQLDAEPARLFLLACQRKRESRTNIQMAASVLGEGGPRKRLPKRLSGILDFWYCVWQAAELRRNGTECGRFTARYVRTAKFFQSQHAGQDL